MEIDKLADLEIVKMRQCDIEQTLTILSDERLEGWRYDDFVEEIERKDSLVLVGKIKNQIISFCGTRLITISSSNSDSFIFTDGNNVENWEENYKSEFEIYNLGVKREFQNQGVGSRLLDCLVKLAEKYNTELFWLEVRCSNKQAINFYQKNNFSQIYERKNFYSHPVENAIVMKRIL